MYLAQHAPAARVADARMALGGHVARGQRWTIVDNAPDAVAMMRE